MAPDRSWHRLGQEIFAARTKRWSRRVDFAKACGLSVRTLVQIENGQPVEHHDETYAAIENCLGWAPGDCQRILEGGKPTADRELQHVINAWPRLGRQTRAIIVGFVDDALAN